MKSSVLNFSDLLRQSPE